MKGEVLSMNPQISSPPPPEYTVSLRVFIDDWKRRSKRRVLKKPQGFLESSVCRAFTISAADSKAEWICQSNVDYLPFLSGQKGWLWEKRAEMFVFTNGIFKLESYFSGLVAMTRDISSFLARGLMVPLLPQVLLVLPIISHSTGLAVWSLAFMAV